MGFECFIGQDYGDDPDVVRERLTMETFAEARTWMASRLVPFVDDSCDDCRRVGTEALLSLVNAPAGSPFTAEVDGFEYVIRQLPAGSS